MITVLTSASTVESVVSKNQLLNEYKEATQVSGGTYIEIEDLDQTRNFPLIKLGQTKWRAVEARLAEVSVKAKKGTKQVDATEMALIDFVTDSEIDSVDLSLFKAALRETSPKASHSQTTRDIIKARNELRSKLIANDPTNVDDEGNPLVFVFKVAR